MRKFTRIVLQIFVLMLFIPVVNAGNPIDSTYKKNILSISLTTPFDPKFPRLRTGYTYMISDRWSVTTEIGYGKKLMFPDSSFYRTKPLKDRYRLWEIRTEGRCYVFGARKNFLPFTAFELYYIHHRAILYNDEFLAENGEYEVSFGKADYLREKYGFNVKFGFIAKFGRSVGMEVYAGGGARARHNHYFNVIQESTSEEWFDDLNYYYHEGLQWSLNMTAGVKFVILF